MSGTDPMDGQRPVDPLADTVVVGPAPAGPPPAAPPPAPPAPADPWPVGSEADPADDLLPPPPPPPGAGWAEPPAPEPPAAAWPMPPAQHGGDAAGPATGWAGAAGAVDDAQGAPTTTDTLPTDSGARIRMVVLSIAMLSIVGGLVFVAGTGILSNGGGEAVASSAPIRIPATPAPTPGAASAGPSASAGDASAQPGASPTSSPRLGSDADQEALRLVVPSGLRGTCARAELVGAQVAALSCTTSDNLVVYYEDYADRASLDQDWAMLLEEQSLSPYQGDCKVGEAGESSWYYTSGDPDVEEGRDACFADGDVPIFVWTDYATTTRMWLFGGEGMKLADMWGRWDEGDLDPVR